MIISYPTTILFLLQTPRTIGAKCGTLNTIVEQESLDLCGILAADPVMGWRFFFTGAAGESSRIMEVEIYVGNLPRATTQEELNTLFSQAGDVAFVDVIKDRKSGESNGFAFITMSAQSEADKAVSMFNAYFLDDHHLKVNLVTSRKKRGLGKI